MNSTYRLIVFDWEGTLGDSLGKIVSVLNKEAMLMNLGVVDERQARHYLMLGLLVALKKIFPDLSLEKSEALLQSIRASLAMRSMDVYLLPGAREIIKTLHQRGLALAIATNRGQHSLQRDLQTVDLEKYFTVTRSAGQVPAKPCPQMLEEIIDWCGAAVPETLMVGDSVSDIEMAVSMNVKAVGVNFYNQPYLVDELLAAGAEKVVDDYQDLVDFILPNEPK